jgi:hypothetical protein
MSILPTGLARRACSDFVAVLVIFNINANVGGQGKLAQAGYCRGHSPPGQALEHDPFRWNRIML